MAKRTLKNVNGELKAELTKAVLKLCTKYNLDPTEVQNDPSILDKAIQATMPKDDLPPAPQARTPKHLSEVAFRSLCAANSINRDAPNADVGLQLALDAKKTKTPAQHDVRVTGSDHVHAAPKQTGKPTLLDDVAICYLTNSFLKMCDGPHPNFVANMKEDRLLMYKMITAAVRKNKELPIKQAVVQSAKLLKEEALWYVTYFKDLVANCAFQAHMEVTRLQKRLNLEEVEESLDAMMDPGDVPVHDVADAQRNPEREEYAGGDNDDSLIAQDPREAYLAIEGIAAWCELAFSSFKPQQLSYWGLESGMPLGQRVITALDGEKSYIPVIDFDDYRQLQAENWKRKQKIAPGADNALDLMADG